MTGVGSFLHGLLKVKPLRANLSQSTVMRMSSSEKPVPVKSESSGSEGEDFFVKPTRIPTNLEKRVLVWTGRYKTMDEIPSRLPQETMERANSKARIRVSNYMILATIVLCMFYVISGKKAAARGESVHKMNLDWHKSIQEEEAKKNEK